MWNTRKGVVLTLLGVLLILLVIENRSLILANIRNVLLARAIVLGNLDDTHAHVAVQMLDVTINDGNNMNPRQSFFVGYIRLLAQQNVQAVRTWSAFPEQAELQGLGIVDNLLHNYYGDMFRAVTAPPSYERIQHAKVMLYALIPIAPHTSSVLFRLGLASQLSGDIDQAKHFYTRALQQKNYANLEKSELEFASAYWLARMYGDRGDIANACQYLAKAMKLTAGDNPASEAYAGWCEIGR